MVAYIGFAATGESFVLLAVWFVLAGIGIGCAETAEAAAVAALDPERLRGLRVAGQHRATQRREVLRRTSVSLGQRIQLPIKDRPGGNIN